MRFTETSLIAAVGFAAIWIASLASCEQDDPNNLLTTNATMMQTVGGSGGTASDGGGGAGANEGGSGGAGATGGSSAGGMGGSGGTPEPVVNGCTSATATDLTGSASPINVDLPGGPYCVRVAKDSTMTFTMPSIGASRYLGGEYNDATGVKSVDADSPIYSCDNIQPFTACPTVNSVSCGTPNPPSCIPPFVFPTVGAYPWFDDFAPGTIRGVVYVE